jgi:hypothetical protein
MYNANVTGIDELIAQPTTEGVQTLIFNKLSGAFVAQVVGSHLDKVNTTYCKGKTATFNPETHIWVGDYDSGSVKSRAETPRIAYEHTLDGTAGMNIRKKYDYHHQLNVIIDTMTLLLDASSLTTSQKASFNAMKEYIAEIRALNVKYKDSYTNDPNWTYKSKTDAQTELDDKLAGGLHEAIGPKIRGQGAVNSGKGY